MYSTAHGTHIVYRTRISGLVDQVFIELHGSLAGCGMHPVMFMVYLLFWNFQIFHF